MPTLQELRASLGDRANERDNFVYLRTLEQAGYDPNTGRLVNTLTASPQAGGIVRSFNAALNRAGIRGTEDEIRNMFGDYVAYQTGVTGEMPSFLSQAAAAEPQTRNWVVENIINPIDNFMDNTVGPVLDTAMPIVAGLATAAGLGSMFVPGASDWFGNVLGGGSSAGGAAATGAGTGVTSGVSSGIASGVGGGSAAAGIGGTMGAASGVASGAVPSFISAIASGAGSAARDVASNLGQSLIARAFQPPQPPEPPGPSPTPTEPGLSTSMDDYLNRLARQDIYRQPSRYRYRGALGG